MVNGAAYSSRSCSAVIDGGKEEGLEEEHKREATGIRPGGWLYQRPRRQVRARQP